jgi:hypothetical protein
MVTGMLESLGRKAAIQTGDAAALVFAFFALAFVQLRVGVGIAEGAPAPLHQVVKQPQRAGVIFPAPPQNGKIKKRVKCPGVVFTKQALPPGHVLLECRQRKTVHTAVEKQRAVNC